MSASEIITPQDMVGRTMGGCKISDLIGQGAMGDVYRAKQISLKRVVAIKILARELSRNTDFIQRFKREAHAVARLNHHNIAAVYDFGSDGYIYYIIMEYIDGQSLEEIVEDEGRIDPMIALDYMIQAANGIGHAHKSGILHRDIKPGNLLVSSEGKTKVLDFGLAKTQYETSSADLTTQGTMMGTPNYMSPEQCCGDPISPASDIYCLGATFYRLIAGQTCFPGDNPVSIMLKHKSENPLPVFLFRSDIPPGCSEVIMKMLAKNPKNRYPDIETLLIDLKRLQQRQLPEATHSKFGVSIVHPRFLDDFHLIRAILQWKLISPEKIKEAIDLQDQVLQVNVEEPLHAILIKKEYLSQNRHQSISSAINRSRRQKVDQAFLEIAQTKKVLTLEKIETVKKNVKALERAGKSKAACHLLVEKNELSYENVVSILHEYLERERVKEETNFKETAIRLGLIKEEEFESTMNGRRPNDIWATYQRPDQVLLAEGILSSENIRSIFKSRLYSILGIKTKSMETPINSLRSKSKGHFSSGTAPTFGKTKTPFSKVSSKDSKILPDFNALKMEMADFCPFCKKEIPTACVYCPYCKNDLRKVNSQKLRDDNKNIGQRRSREKGSKTILPDRWIAQMPGGGKTKSLSFAAIENLISARKIRAETLVQTPFSKGRWVRADSVKELVRLFKNQ